MCVLTALPALHHLTHAVRSPALLQSHFSISLAFLEKAGSRLSAGRRGAWGQQPSPHTQPGSRAPRVQHLRGGSTALDFFWNCATWFVFHPATLSLPHMNQLNPSSSLQQINTHIFPIAYCRLQNWVYLFQTARGKISKTGFTLTERASLICCLWPKIQHKPGALCFSSLAQILMSHVTAWRGSRARCLRSLRSAAEVQTGEHLPQRDGRASFCASLNGDFQYS